jgi:hypothetical protein
MLCGIPVNAYCIWNDQSVPLPAMVCSYYIDMRKTKCAYELLQLALRSRFRFYVDPCYPACACVAALQYERSLITVGTPFAPQFTKTALYSMRQVAPICSHPRLQARLRAPLLPPGSVIALDDSTSEASPSSWDGRSPAAGSHEPQPPLAPPAPAVLVVPAAGASTGTRGRGRGRARAAAITVRAFVA